MSKPFHVEAAQRTADDLRKQMRGKKYLHYKTRGEYEVLDVAVNEADGVVLVIYKSLVFGYVWARPWSDFTEYVDATPSSWGVPRFKEIE